MTPDAPLQTPYGYRMVALIAEVPQSMESDTTTASLLASDRSTGGGTPPSTALPSTCAPTSTIT